MVFSAAALWASSAAISSMISWGVRWATGSAAVGFLVDGLGVQGPGLGRIGAGLSQQNELGEVGVVEGVGLAEIAAGVELVIPDLAGLRACAPCLRRADWPGSHRSGPCPGCRRG